ncbi:MAG: hypothetical protein IPP47_05340 [Bryobacterales bacterium]|nr:hypothetical protein [Bryobacterales bacterium]
MNTEQRIAAIRMSLAAIEGGIAQIQAALRVAASLNDIARLNDELVSLMAKRTQLQLELLNLEASLVKVDPAAPPAAKISAADKKEVKGLSKELQQSMADRRMVEAALANSGDILTNINRMQSVLSGTPAPETKP